MLYKIYRTVMKWKQNFQACTLFVQVKTRHQRVQQQTETELRNLRKELKASQTELQQTEHRLKQELHNLQTQLTSTNSTTMEALEGRMRELQKKHGRAVTRLKEQHERERALWTRRQQGSDEGVESVCQEIQVGIVKAFFFFCFERLCLQLCSQLKWSWWRYLMVWFDPSDQQNSVKSAEAMWHKLVGIVL